MLDIGFSEILVIFVLALIVLGPEKLPRVAAQVGRWLGRARAMARQFREQLEEEVNLEETRKQEKRREDERKATQRPPDPSPQGSAPGSGAAPSDTPGGGTQEAPHQDLTHEPWPYIAPVPPPEVSDLFGDMLTPPRASGGDAASQGATSGPATSGPATSGPAASGPTAEAEPSTATSHAGESTAGPGSAPRTGASTGHSGIPPEAQAAQPQVHWPHDQYVPETTIEKASPDAQPTTHERGT